MPSVTVSCTYFVPTFWNVNFSVAPLPSGQEPRPSDPTSCHVKEQGPAEQDDDPPLKVTSCPAVGAVGAKENAALGAAGVGVGDGVGVAAGGSGVEVGVGAGGSGVGVGVGVGSGAGAGAGAGAVAVQSTSTQ